MSLPKTMSSRRAPADALASRVQKLDQLAAERRQGACFNITRLTLVKRLCAEPAVTARFHLVLTKVKLAYTPARHGGRFPSWPVHR